MLAVMDAELTLRGWKCAIKDSLSKRCALSFRAKRQGRVYAETPRCPPELKAAREKNPAHSRCRLHERQCHHDAFVGKLAASSCVGARVMIRGHQLLMKEILDGNKARTWPALTVEHPSRIDSRTNDMARSQKRCDAAWAQRATQTHCRRHTASSYSHGSFLKR